jgi:hypothetical protein
MACIDYRKATYSNLENHPRLIRINRSVKMQTIHLDPKSGLPSSSSVSQEKDFSLDYVKGRGRVPDDSMHCVL